MASRLVYENEETQRLDNLYDISSYKRPADPTMPAPQISAAAFEFLSVSQKEGRLVGIRTTDLDLMVKLAECDQFEGITGQGLNESTVEALWAKEYATVAEVEGEQVMFPTEKLMINQKVPTK